MLDNSLNNVLVCYLFFYYQILLLKKLKILFFMKINKNPLKKILVEKKYRPILISIFFFLLFDIGILIPNFLFSTSLKKDAISINLAGRQRTLSQRITKALLQLKNANENGYSLDKYKTDLLISSQLFDETLNAFQKGGYVKNNDGESIYLKAVETKKAEKILKKTFVIWNPYKEQIQNILAAKKNIPYKQLRNTVGYGNENNFKLLRLMGDLTNEQEGIAEQKAEYLQIIQLVGMALALGNFFVILFNILTRLQKADKDIQVAHDKISELNEQLKAENVRMSSELDITRRLQQMILPKSWELQSVDGLDIAGFMEAADEVGGDYYDVLNIDGNVKIGIGDVTGHGLESGMLMLMVQTAVRTLQEVEETDPVKFMDALNRTIYKNIQRMNSGKNLTLSLIDYQQGQLCLTGQHEEMIVVRSSGKVELVDTSDLGFPIGLDEEIADFVDQQRVSLNAGDIAVLFTDGITEAENIDSELYGLEKLCHAIKENRHLTAEEIKNAIVNDVREHIGEQQVFDDITLLVLKQKDISSSFGTVNSQALQPMSV
ncbi:SpoIIE family protein phosphatase [Mastigocoleus testarum]|nr:SpoIIE family protein phosphatase [Mastigocoleus testarum]